MNHVQKFVIEPADPRDPQCRALLKQSHELMQELFSEEDNHYLEIDELCVDTVHFYGARAGDQILGCGAFREDDGYVEIKSMFTAPSARGQGIADAILSHLLAEAQAAGYGCIRLETGDTLTAAHRLYARYGFRVRGPFGDYPDSPASVFMEKQLN